MLISVIKAEYISDYKVLLTFNTNQVFPIDLEESIFNDPREIFKPLRDFDFFKKFDLDEWTLTWPNHADFAPEYLYELARNQSKQLIQSFQ